MSRFNSLKRGQMYSFVFMGGITFLTGVFHDIRSDGTLHVSDGVHEYFLNPDNIVYARMTA